MVPRTFLSAAAAFAFAVSVAQAVEPMTIDFAKLAPDATYTAERGSGYEVAPAKPGDPFVFSAKVPEGDYDVTIAFGSDAAAGATGVKAEARRLMIERVASRRGPARR